MLPAGALRFSAHSGPAFSLEAECQTLDIDLVRAQTTKIAGGAATAGDLNAPVGTKAGNLAVGSPAIRIVFRH